MLSYAVGNQLIEISNFKLLHWCESLRNGIVFFLDKSSNYIYSGILTIQENQLCESDIIKINKSKLKI